MGALGITMDGREYRVWIVENTYADSFELIEGPNAGDMLNYRHERDLLGTADTYEMAVEPDPRFPQDYIDFYEAIRQPVDTHSITVIDGNGTLTYDAMIKSGSRVYAGKRNGKSLYRGITVQFVPVVPQWEADG